jgi:hypothetical protein
MTHYTGHPGRNKPEVLINQSEEHGIAKSKLVSLLNRILQFISTILTRGNEPQVWQSCDRFGQTWWHAYDPITDRYVCRDSEADILIWIEERYYQ